MTPKLDTAKIPQHVKLQIGGIFYKAFMQDFDTPEFQECFRQWRQEKEEKERST